MNQPKKVPVKVARAKKPEVEPTVISRVSNVESRKDDANIKDKNGKISESPRSNIGSTKIGSQTGSPDGRVGSSTNPKPLNVEEALKKLKAEVSPKVSRLKSVEIPPDPLLARNLRSPQEDSRLISQKQAELSRREDLIKEREQKLEASLRQLERSKKPIEPIWTARTEEGTKTDYPSEKRRTPIPVREILGNIRKDSEVNKSDIISPVTSESSRKEVKREKLDSRKNEIKNTEIKSNQILSPIASRLSNVSRQVEDSRRQNEEIFENARKRKETYELERVLLEEKQRLDAEKLQFVSDQNKITEQLEQRAKELDEKARLLTEQQLNYSAEKDQAEERKKQILGDIELNLKIRELEKALGVIFPTDANERIACFKSIIKYKKKQSFRKNARRLFLFVCVTIEFALTDLLGLSVGGLADDQFSQIRDYDDILDDIGDKFFSDGVKMAPELRMSLLFGFNLFLFIVANYALSFGISKDYVESGKTTVKDLVAKTFLIDDPAITSLPDDTETTVSFGAWKLQRAWKEAGKQAAEPSRKKGPPFAE